MRILFITPYIPNEVRPRPFNFLKELAPRHEITLISPVFNNDEADDAVQLEREITGLKVIPVVCPKIQCYTRSLLALPYGLPMQSRYCYSPNFINQARELIRSSTCDLVHIEHLRAAFMGRELAAVGIPLVYDAVDSISLLVERTLRYGSARQRALSLVELAAIRRYERDLLLSNYLQEVCATSQEDAGALEQLAAWPSGQPRRPVRIVPNGVNTAVFSPPLLNHERVKDTVVFSGKMSYHANSAAAHYLLKEIWPRVRQARPEARLWIVGSHPPPSLQAQSGRQGVLVTGYVKDLPGYLQRASVAVAPMVYSVGIQNKVLEALACATPVIATGDVSRAISADNGQEMYLVAPRQPAEFASRIIELLQNPAKAVAMGQRGRDLVLNNYTWTEAAGRLEQLWASLTNSSRPVASLDYTPVS